MDAVQKAAAAAAAEARVYQDFAPQTEVIVEADCDMLVVYLSGFKKEHLRVQVTKTRNLIVSGEHPIGDNIWRRFRQTFPVSTDRDICKITAKFEDLILYIRLPKLIATAEKQDEEKTTSTTKAPESAKPVNDQNPPNNPAEHIDEKSNAPAETDGSFSEKVKEEENEQKASAEKSKESKDSKNMTESDSSSGITKLKMAREVLYVVLALLLAVVIGQYVQKFTWFLGEKAGN